MPSEHILVVDDNLAIRELLTTLLTEEGYTVTEAADGLAALRLVDQVQPDLILLDYMMPRMDGPTFIECYHQLPTTHAPIVMVTSMDLPATQVAEWHAHAYVRKPFEFETLIDVIRPHLRPVAAPETLPSLVLSPAALELRLAEVLAQIEALRRQGLKQRRQSQRLCQRARHLHGRARHLSVALPPPS